MKSGRKPIGRGGRLTAEQQLAMQKKEKRGAKARKELLAEEVRTREETEAEMDREFAEFASLQESELALTKVRLIARLTQNLDELRLTSGRAISQAETANQHLTNGIADLCSALAEDGIVDVKAGTLIKQHGPAKEIGEAVRSMGIAVAARLRDNETTARKAERDMAVMTEALTQTKKQLCAAESIIASRHVRSTTEYLSAAELYRELGSEFEQRMRRLEADRREAFQDVIRRAAEPKYHLFNGTTAAGKKLSPLDAHPNEELKQRFLSFSERSLIDQSELLLDIQREIAKLNSQHLRQCGDRIRRDRSNLAPNIRAQLHHPDTSPEDLLRILDYVSFEPRVAEAVAAIVQERADSEASEVAVLPRAGHDTITAAAEAANVPAPLSVLPPRAGKMAFVRASLVDAAARVKPGFGYTDARQAEALQ